MTQFHFLRVGSVLGGLSLALLLTGCGNGTTSNTTQTEADTPAQETTDSPPPTQSAPPAYPSNQSLVSERDGKKWIGDVPVDVWFNDPLAVAAQAGETAAPTANNTEVAGVTNPPSETQPMPMEVPAKTGGGLDWKRIIPGDVLDAEVTTIRNRFNADLQTVGSYNRSYLALPPHAVTLAVMAHIAEKHPDEIRWKENAKYIKHLAGQMNAEPLRSGPSSQKPLKENFDNITEILSGSVPATLKAPPEDEPASEVAKVSYLMKRLENASKFITVNGGTEDAMKSKAAELKQEAAVLGELTQILTQGYEDYEGDDVFAGYVKNMVDSSINMREHIQSEQFDKFELDVSAMNKACQDCHSTYR